MYLRTTSQTRKDGTVVRYLQLAHNVWNAEKGRSDATVLYNFGRENAQTRDTLERLVRSLSRYLAPGEQELGEPAISDFAFVESRPLGGAYVRIPPKPIRRSTLMPISPSTSWRSDRSEATL